jgi:tripartite-type tricarboxylate transporter receptor subunit TctC
MKAMRRSRTRITIGAVVLICCIPFRECGAQSTDDRYKGRTINLIIGAGPGGGIDLDGRLVARHIGRHLPGQPNVLP